MSQAEVESLVEQHIAQLEAISERRNALLREMYVMMKKRSNVGAVIAIDDDENDDLHAFLNKYDLRKNPETGYISELPQSELFELVPPQATHPSVSPPLYRPPSRAQSRASRSKSVLSDFGLDSVAEEGPNKLREASEVRDSTLVPIESDDELDLLGPSLSVPDPLQTTPSTERSGVIHISDSLESTQIIPVGGSPEKEREVESSERDLADQHIEQEVQPIPSTTSDTDITSDHLEPITEASDNAIEQIPPPPLSVQQLVETEGASHEPEDQLAATTSDVPDDSMVIDEPTIDDSKQLSLAPALDVSEEFTLATQAHLPAAEVQTIATEVAQANADSSMVLDLEPEDNLPALESEFDDITSLNQPASEPVQGTPNQMTEDTQADSSPQLRYPTFPLQLDGSSTPELIVQALPPSPIYIPVPSSPYRSFPDGFHFPNLSFDKAPPASPVSPAQPRHQLEWKYPLPPVDSLPAEFNRRAKKNKQKKKEKEREKEKGEKADKSDNKKERDGRDDWAPWGINRWNATIRTNPVYKKVSKATKCLSTRDWGIAMSELKLLRTMDRIDMLKSKGRWSFRQPKKQRGVGGLAKTHWDYLMDEMRWMRTDFREERKWKMALAYNLSTAVLEWHAAGTWEKRIKRGICVLWKPPRQDKRRDGMTDDVNEIVDPMDLEEPTSQAVAEKTPSSLLMVDYGSDDEEDDEQEKDVDDALDPATLIEEAFRASKPDETGEGIGMKDVEPKREEVEDSSALQDSSVDVSGHVVASESGQGENNEAFVGKNEDDTSNDPNTTSPIGLKATSGNPMLHSKSTALIPHSKSSKISLYAPLRERIAYSEVEKLFLDINDFHITTHDTATDDSRTEYLPPPSDLSDIFPDFQPFGLLDFVPVAPNPTVADGKKKSDRRSERDDPNKRVEETSYTKIYPASKFMYNKPTLIGALQPSKHLKDGHWTALDESAILVEYDGQPAVRLTEDFNNGIFEHKPNPIQIVTPAFPSNPAAMQSPLPKFKEPPKRTIDHLWNASDDALLKSLVDKFPNNWDLIAECYNTSRLTVKTDWRTSRDCQERWRERWGVGAQRMMDPPGIESTPPPSTSSQVTTRGVKRLASNSVSSATAGAFTAGSGSEPKKRRRHAMVQEAIRKSAKRRNEALQKNSARKNPMTHESHSQFNKMQKMSPADLSRRKAEQDMAQSTQIQLARRTALGTNGQNRGPVTQGQPTNSAPAANGVPRSSTAGLPSQGGVPQIRSQVNISQQQRSATPLVAANSRLSPQQQQQILQAQVQSQSQLALSQQQLSHALAQVQAHQAMQAQQAAAAAAAGDPSQPQNGVNGAGAQMVSAHLSPPYVGSRDATSSPAHASPPRTSATPSNAAVNSPRPPSAQAQTHSQGQTQVQAQASGQQMQGQPPVPTQAGILQNGSIAAMNIPRATTIQGHYYLPNVQSYTHEHIQTMLRIQAMQAQQQAQAAQQQHGMNQAQNGAYPQQ